MKNLKVEARGNAGDRQNICIAGDRYDIMRNSNMADALDKERADVRMYCNSSINNSSKNNLETHLKNLQDCFLVKFQKKIPIFIPSKLHLCRIIGGCVH